MADKMTFDRQTLPVGDDQIPVLVARDGTKPKAVFMSYDSFLELAATLYTAIETLKVAGVDPSVLSDEDLEEDFAEFRDWDRSFTDPEEEYTPHLRLVVGG